VEEPLELYQQEKMQLLKEQLLFVFFLTFLHPQNYSSFAQYYITKEINLTKNFIHRTFLAI